MKLLNLIILLSIILSPVTLAATIHGTVYELSLDPVKNIVVEIDTHPAQRLVSKTGSYSFEVPKGEYIITAKKTSTSEPLVQEKISVTAEGDYILDLFVFPEVETKQEKTNYLLYIMPIILILMVLSLIIYKLYKKKPKQIKEEPKEEELLKKVLETIKNNEGRITQKELRKQFPLSEAKISLVITQLEKEGKLEKIKKGRGNILILK